MFWNKDDFKPDLRNTMQRGMCNLFLNPILHIQPKYWDKLCSCKYLVTRTSNGTGQGCQQKLHLLTLAKCPQDKSLLIFIDNTLRKSEEPDHAYHFDLKALARPTLAAQIIWLQLQSKWENNTSTRLANTQLWASLKVVRNRDFWNILSHQALIHSKNFGFVNQTGSKSVWQTEVFTVKIKGLTESIHVIKRIRLLSYTYRITDFT